MGRLFTSWRSSRHAFQPDPYQKSSPFAWQSVQQTATPHPGCEGLRLPCEQRRIWPWFPRIVAALHWRIAKSGRGPGPQAYVSPRALVHIWNAATAPDDRAVAALAALSWTMWLRVGEAASIRYCDLGRKEGLWFYSTKVGEPGWVCRPAAAYARSWMEFLRVYCNAKGK